MVAILVLNHGQQLEQAWKFTLREFFFIADCRNELRKRNSKAVAMDDIGGLTQHLKNMGVAI